MPAELLSPGERLVGRRLTVEKRLGVEHYVTGQLAVKVSDADPEAYEVSWVDRMGHACLLIALRDADEWVVLPIFTRIGHGGFQEQRRLPEHFRLTDGMVAALDALATDGRQSA